MRGNRVVVGVFSYMDDTIAAINAAKEADYDVKVYSPVPNHALEEATSHTRSPIRIISLIGAMTGLTAGFALAILCSLDWPIRVSAKDIVTPPAFFVVGYECTILFGAIFTLMAMLHFSRVPDLFRKVGYDPRFTRDKFGVVVGCESEQIEDVKKKLLDVGADEVEVKDGL